MRDEDYFAVTKQWARPITTYNLEKMPGIYMISNKVNKKFYIGMSTNLKRRFYNYMDLNRLKNDQSTRIHRALLKYGFDKFKITLLELPHEKNITSTFLRKREDFYIRVFKPQYNIKRSSFNVDLYKGGNKWVKNQIDIPTRIKNLIDKCLDPARLDYNLMIFKLNKKKDTFYFVASTNNTIIRANSSGWLQGNIEKPEGFEVHNVGKPSINTIILSQYFVDKTNLAKFYHHKEPGFVRERLKMKLKALKIKAKNT